MWRDSVPGPATLDITLRRAASSATEYRLDGSSTAVPSFDGRMMRRVIVGSDVVIYEFGR